MSLPSTIILSSKSFSQKAANIVLQVFSVILIKKKQLFLDSFSIGDKMKSNKNSIIPPFTLRVYIYYALIFITPIVVAWTWNIGLDLFTLKESMHAFCQPIVLFLSFLILGGYTAFLIYNDKKLHSMYMWMLGSFGGRSWNELKLIIEKYAGGPVGIETLAAALGEDSRTLEDVCEPFLLQTGLLQRTPRGRKATAQSYKHLGYKNYSEQQKMF